MTRKAVAHRAFTDPLPRRSRSAPRNLTKWSRRHLGALVAAQGWTPERVAEATGYDVMGLRSAFAGNTIPSLELVIRLHALLPGVGWDALIDACKPVLNEYLRKRREHRNRRPLEVPRA